MVHKTLLAESDKAKSIDIKIIEHKVNGGPSVARNTALKAVTGDYIFLLDADDEYHPGLFSKAEHIFNAYDASLLFLQFERDIGGRVLPIIDGLGSTIHCEEKNIHAIPNLIAAFGHDSFGMNGSSVVCKRSVLEGLYYQENLNCFEGLEYWYRVAKNMQKLDGKAYLLSAIQVTIHLTANSVSRKLVDNGGEIYLPLQFSQLRHSPDVDDQRLRKRIYTIWIRNALLKMPRLSQRLRFFWQYRKQVMLNTYLNLRYC